MKKLLTMIGASAMLLAACAGEEAGEETEMTVDLGEGKELYEENCLSCHGDDLDGMAADDVLKAIAEGPGSMPADLVEGEDAENIAAYLEDEG